MDHPRSATNKPEVLLKKQKSSLYLMFFVTATTSMCKKHHYESQFDDHISIQARWWFQRFFIFIPIWGR